MTHLYRKKNFFMTQSALASSESHLRLVTCKIKNVLQTFCRRFADVLQNFIVLC